MVDEGAFREAELTALLTGAKYPVRNVVQNVNDLKAQIAANEKGVAELRRMVAQFGLDVVQAYMDHVQDNAAESVRKVLDRLPADVSFSYEMDQGCFIMFGSPSTARRARPPSISPAPRRSATTISTRPSR